MRVTARSMWPFSAHFVSYMGDLAGAPNDSTAQFAAWQG